VQIQMGGTSETICGNHRNIFPMRVEGGGLSQYKGHNKGGVPLKWKTIKRGKAKKMILKGGFNKTKEKKKNPEKTSGGRQCVGGGELRFKYPGVQGRFPRS